MRTLGSAALAAVMLAASMPVQRAAGQTPDPPHPSVELPAALDRVLRDYERAWSAGDAAALAELFTEDGFATSRSDWVRGRSAIRREYQRAGGALRLRALAFATEGDTGWIVGAYGYGGDAPRGDMGKFILTLRQVDGRWLIAADLDSTNRPPGD